MLHIPAASSGVGLGVGDGAAGTEADAPAAGEPAVEHEAATTRASASPTSDPTPRGETRGRVKASAEALRELDRSHRDGLRIGRGRFRLPCCWESRRPRHPVARGVRHERPWTLRRLHGPPERDRVSGRGARSVGPLGHRPPSPDRHRDVRPRPVRLALEPPQVDGRDRQRAVVEERAHRLDRGPGIATQLRRGVAEDVEPGRRQAGRRR